MTRRTRAKAEYLAYVSAREWPIAASGIGVVLGAATVLPSAFGIVLSVLAPALGTATYRRRT